MGSSINLGGFSKDGEAKAGIISNFPVKEFIEKKMEAENKKLKDLQDVIILSDSKITKYYELKDMLENLQNSLDYLNSEVFEHFNVQTTMYGSMQQADTYINATADVGIQPTTYRLQISQLATPMSMMSQSFSSNTNSIVGASGSNDPNMFSAGTFLINSHPITLDQNDTMQDVMAAINNVSNTTNVTANIFEVTSGNYNLILQSNSTGTANAFTISDPDNTLGNISFTTTNAVDANFKLNNVNITRSTNTIDDVVSNMTIDLFATTPTGSTIGINVTSDLPAISAAVHEFIDTYNAAVHFINEQQTRDNSGDLVEGAVIGDDAFMTNLQSDLSSAIQYMTPNGSSLKIYGIMLELVPSFSNNQQILSPKLKINEGVFQKQLALDPKELRNLFGFNYSANPALAEIARHNTLPVGVNNFVLDIDTGQPVGSQVKLTYTIAGSSKVEYGNYTPTTSGGNIRVSSSSAFAGLNIVYRGNGRDTIHLSFSQGIADILYDKLTDYYLPSNGMIQSSIQTVLQNNFFNQNAVAQQEISNAQLKESLVKRFAKLEEQAVKFDNDISYLKYNAKLSNK